MPSLFLNNKKVSFKNEQTILDVAKENNIRIPTLCHIPGLDATGVCRMCVVKVEGSDRLLPACTTPACESMRISTDTPEIRQARKTILEMITASGIHNCFVTDQPTATWSETQKKVMQQPWHEKMCPAHKDCRLQDLAVEYGVNMKNVGPVIDGYPLDDLQPMIVRDFSRCIGCGRCYQACNVIQVNNAIPAPYGRRADHPEGWYPAANYEKCTHCGECVQACPVGALFEKKAYGLSRNDETKTVRTTCPYCGVGCQLLLHVKDEKIVKVTGVEDGAPNYGRLCVKGRFGYDFIYSDKRLKTPLIKENGELREASWDEALDLVANKFKEIIQHHGPDAVAGVSCARSINEDSYQMQKLFRSVFKTNNIDHCART